MTCTYLRRALVIAICAVLAASALVALEVPAAPTAFFTDRANLVDSSRGAALNAKLRSFEQSSGAQFIIYAFPSLEGEALEDFTIRCAERWKVGNKKYDNGVILFVFGKERKLRLEVGYGLEPTLTDAFTSRITHEVIPPYFQRADYAGGLDAAADAVIARIQKKEAPVAPFRRSAPGARGNDFSPIFILVIIVIFLVFLLPMLRRGGGCGGCWPLFLPFGGGGTTFGGGGGGGWGGGGGFSGGGGSFGGGGSSGGW